MRPAVAKKPMKRLKAFFMPVWRRVYFGIDQAWYWLRTHTVDRYHMLDLRCHEYKWGWRDRDMLILYACFNLLQAYVEQEDPFGFIDWDDNLVAQHIGNEIRALYAWWTEERPMRNQIQSSYEAYESFDIEDDEMLLRLMKIRRHLWT